VTHEAARELLPVYALDALETAEAREVEMHLLTCEICRRELSQMRETTASLAAAEPQVAPPRHLREQIVAAIRPQPEVVIIPRLWAIGAAAAAAALIIVASLAASRFSHEVSLLQQRVARQEQILSVLTGPGAKTTALAGSVQANVKFVYDPARGQGALVVMDLRDPGRQQVYQLWLISGTTPESAGVFRPEAGRPVVVPVRADFTRYQAVAVSIERAPFGALRPTTNPILVGRI
jgi:anti-sigma-K factor RskA